jgi:hypothetical protein
MFYVMDAIEAMASYPLAAVPKRWKMSEMALILPTISQGILDLEQLRTRLLVGGGDGDDLEQLRTRLLVGGCDGDATEAAPVLRRSTLSDFAYVKLRKHEISDSVVVSEIQKRNECERVFEGVVAFAMTLPTRRAKDFVVDLEAVLAGLLAKWTVGANSAASVTVDQIHTTSVRPAGGSVAAITMSAHTRATNAVEWRAWRAAMDVEADSGTEEENENANADAGDSTHHLIQSKSLLTGIQVDARGRVKHGDVLKKAVTSFGSCVGNDGGGRLGSLPEVDLDLLMGVLSTELPTETALTVEDATEHGIMPSPGPPNSPKRDDGILQSLKLRSLTAKGKRKADGQRSASKTRYATVTLSGKKFPLDIFEANVLTRCSTHQRASSLQSLVPRILVESVVLNRSIKVRFAERHPRLRNQFNGIPNRKVLDLVAAALARAREASTSYSTAIAVENTSDAWRPQYVVFIGSMIEIPEDVVTSYRDFYDLQDLVSAFSNAVAWVAGNWNSMPQIVPFLQQDAEVVEGVGALTTARMRAAVTQALETSAIAASLVLRTGQQSQSLSIGKLIGHLAFQQRLNDGVVNFALHVLAARHPDVVAIDSLNVGKGYVSEAELRATRVVCFPLHFPPSHWCIVLVVIGGANAQVYGYDPANTEACERFMQDMWATWCRVLLERWHQRDERRVAFRDTPDIDRLSISEMMAVGSSQHDGQTTSSNSATTTTRTI